MGENIGYSPLNNIQEKYMITQLENLNKQIIISEKIDIIMEQTLELMDMVNKNQSKINELKIEQEQLKTHTDNATDSLIS
jgi:hypothetical protein